MCVRITDEQYEGIYTYSCCAGCVGVGMQRVFFFFFFPLKKYYLSCFSGNRAHITRSYYIHIYIYIYTHANTSVAYAH